MRPLIPIFLVIFLIALITGFCFAENIHDIILNIDRHEKNDLENHKLNQLLKKDPSLVNQYNKEGYTPLHMASRCNNLNVVKFLVSKGAGLEAKDQEGMTPLHYAAMYHRYNNARFLIEKGAKINARDNNGFTPIQKLMYFTRVPFYQASKPGGEYVKFFEYMIAKGADVNTRSNAGYTPLHQAARWGDKTLILLFLENRAKVNARITSGEEKGLTPLKIAEQQLKNTGDKDEKSIKLFREVMKILKKHGGKE